MLRLIAKMPIISANLIAGILTISYPRDTAGDQDERCHFEGAKFKCVEVCATQLSDAGLRCWKSRKVRAPNGWRFKHSSLKSKLGFASSGGSCKVEPYYDVGLEPLLGTQSKIILTVSSQNPQSLDEKVSCSFRGEIEEVNESEGNEEE